MHEIKMPQLGQSVEEASIITWFKQEGDRVESGDPLFSVQTDKAEIECESTAGGVLRKILIDPDLEVPVLTVVALVGEAEEALPDLDGYAAPSSPGPASQPEPAATEAAPIPESTPTGSAPVAAGGKAFVSPRARTAAEELKVDPKFATASGAGGRVIAADVAAYAQTAATVRITPTARRSAQNAGIDITKVTGTGARGKVMKADVAAAAKAPRPLPAGESQVVPLNPMRQIIAERMVDSMFTAPHYYVTVEVDMAAAVAFRSACAEDAKPSFNDLILRAVTLAVLEYPAVNARWLGDAIEIVGDVNLGFAVALENGLIVPVIKQAQNKTLADISLESRTLAEKARTGKLVPDDYTDNTLTISNLGVFGVDQFTAIINAPDSAIIAVAQIKDRPVVVDGGIHIRPIMKMTMSSDHRVIDGALAAQFMGRAKDILENAEF